MEMEAARGEGGAVGFGEKVLAEDFVRRPEATEILIEATDPLREVAHEMQIVGDENDGQIEIGVELVQEHLEFFRAAAIDAGGGFVEE